METVGSPITRAIGLLSASEIYYASNDGDIELSTSREASIKLDDAATGTAGALFSLYQMNCTAFMGSHSADWFARPGAAASLVVEY